MTAKIGEVSKIPEKLTTSFMDVPLKGSGSIYFALKESKILKRQFHDAKQLTSILLFSHGSGLI